MDIKYATVVQKELPLLEDLKNTWQGFSEDKVPRLASSIAFATIFALAPLLIVLIAILGYVIGVENGAHGHRDAERALLDQISARAGGQTSEAVRGMIAAAFPSVSMMGEAS